MTLEQALAFGLMAAAVVFFIWGRFRYDLVALTALATGALIGVVPVDEMFSGFSNDLIWIIASALVLSAAIARSGLIESMLSPVLSRLKSPATQIPAFAGAVMLLSMVTKNIGALAIMMPVALQIARKTGTPASQLLMPMAFASLLGGVVTLVGTSPNVIVSSVRESLLGEPYRLFDFAPVGLGVCVVGFAFLAVAPFFIRIDRKAAAGVEAALDEARYVTEMSLPEGSPLVGQTGDDLLKTAGGDVKLLSIVRSGKRRAFSAEEVLAEGDSLIVEGDQDDLEKFSASTKLTLTGERHREEKESADEVRVVEGVIGQTSGLTGRTVAQSRLHERYGLSLLAVSRGGSRISTELRSVRLRAGDVVIVKAGDADIGSAFAELHVLPLTERKVALGMKRFGFAPIVLLGAAIAAISLGWAPIHLAFFAAAVSVLLLRVMSVTEAYRAIDGSMLVLLAALIPISEAIDRTGGAALLAGPLAELLRPMPSYMAVATLIVVGMAITPFLNNAATVLIVAPIASVVAKSLGVNPDAYLMAVAIGAASDFLTPIGHQCNTLVMGPGGYRFGDYWRLGLPLSVIVIVVATPLIVLVWGGAAPPIPAP
jgi:di/tricarboxylate transporter